MYKINSNWNCIAAYNYIIWKFFRYIYNLSIESYKTIIIIAFTSGAIGLQNLAASHTTIYELVWPLSAVLIDWLIRGKALSLAQMIGAITLVSSVTILTKENSSE